MIHCVLSAVVSGGLKSVLPRDCRNRKKQHLLNRQRVLHTLTFSSEITPCQGIKNSKPVADNFAWDLCRLFSVRCAFTHQAQCSFDLCKSCDWEHRARLSFWESNCCHSSFNLQRTGRLHVAGFEGEKSSPHLPRIVSPPHCAAVEFSLSPLSF